MRTRCLVALVFMSLCAAPVAHAQTASKLDRAKRQLSDLLFDEALDSLKKALEAGSSPPRTTAEIHQLLGETYATLGDEVLAELHFSHSLSIDPDASLPKGSSPKLTKPFDTAKNALAEEAPLKIRHAVKSANPPRLLLVVVDDPTSLVAGAHARYTDSSGAKQTKTTEGSQSIDIELPAGADRVILSAIDEHGNQLARIGTASDPIAFGELGKTVAAIDPQPTRERDDSDSSPPGRGYTIAWIATGTLAVGLAAAGTFYGLSAQSTVDDINELTLNSDTVEFGTDVKPLEDDARRDALISNIAFGAAGASAVVAALILWKSLGEGGEPEDSSPAAIGPLVSPNARGVAASFTF